MTTSNEGLNRGYNGVAGTVDQFSMHTGNPGTTGANEVTGGTYARVAETYGAPTAGAGDMAGSAVFNIPAATEVTHWGAWDGTDFLFGQALTAPQEFTTAGTYTLTSAPYAASNPP